jgi:uncharacterized protein YggE
MFRILFATFVVCLLFSCNGAKKDAPTIRVSGEGKIRIKPDLINLTIHINFVQPRMADLLAYDDAQNSALTLCETAKVKLGKLVYLTNIGEAETGEPVYSNMGNINKFNKSYGGAGFKVTPEVLVFGRKVISEYRISD